MKTSTAEFLIIVLLFVLALGFLFGAKGCVGANDHDKWNNGVCVKCGGEYNFSSATSRYGWGDEYYYTCEDCGFTIKTQQLMDK